MQSQTVIVTGANSGMGLATTVELARKGAHVIMLCRSQQRGEQALSEARQQSGSDRIELMLCDLGSLASIRAFGTTFLAKHNVLDVLVNNAGVFTVKRQTTADGFEAMTGVNHLGHFLLTNLLLEAIVRAPQGRIVNVSSGAHKIGRFDFDNPYLTQGFSMWKGYAQSKIANIWFTRELAKRLAGTTATANALHPGAVGTSIGVDRDTGFGKAMHRVLRPFFLTPAQGAETAIYLASSPDVSTVSGEYFYRKKEAPISDRAKDEDIASQFWAWSEREVGLRAHRDN
ncbi:NAD(P)-dependent dehydrogenase, short-chain alcohol dehydrogenase family [Paenibacillus sp. yr247]|uniref:SDR family oxidoreductase n=1 Tax=Paenibacillus sp. yr247 TaxID=1761880 RepID=UPI00087EB377|nr:SDR family oxidoreductase [Paenibacillus sp. yr247]SDO02216.1 NAD(P)-dependent dehydrogenase, short-chain alcohol dehydrogenase family [Paenibacillus sp. yr247]